MSAPMNPAAPPAKSRPSSVTISSYLLYLVAALQVIGFIAVLSVAGIYSDVYEAAFAGTELEDSAGAFGVGTIIFAAVVSLIIAIGLVVLAILNNRGKNPARIITWVLGGIFLCCTGLGLVGALAGNVFGTGASTDPNVPDQAEIQRMLEEQLPGWYMPFTIVSSVLSLIALLVALILLALPASNEFFRKPQAVWEPPMPGSVYPGQPQGEPGYPPTQPPGETPGPPAPPAI